MQVQAKHSEGQAGVGNKHRCIGEQATCGRERGSSQGQEFILKDGARRQAGAGKKHRRDRNAGGTGTQEGQGHWRDRTGTQKAGTGQYHWLSTKQAQIISGTEQRNTNNLNTRR